MEGGVGAVGMCENYGSWNLCVVDGMVVGTWWW